MYCCTPLYSMVGLRYVLLHVFVVHGRSEVCTVARLCAGVCTVTHLCSPW